MVLVSILLELIINWRRQWYKKIQYCVTHAALEVGIYLVLWNHRRTFVC